MKHVGYDLCRPRGAVEPTGHVHENRRTDGHQRVGAKARRALPDLALEPNRRSEQECGD
jgi:hypothetical protein